MSTLVNSTVSKCVRNLERERDGGTAAEIILLNERRLMASKATIRKYDNALAKLDPESSKAKSLRGLRGFEESSVRDWEGKIEAAKGDVVPISETRRVELNKEIDDLRQSVVKLNSSIKEINARPNVAPLVKRLEAANEPFKV